MLPLQGPLDRLPLRPSLRSTGLPRLPGQTLRAISMGLGEHLPSVMLQQLGKGMWSPNLLPSSALPTPGFSLRCRHAVFPGPFTVAVTRGLWSPGRPLSKAVGLDLGQGTGGKWPRWVLLGLLPAQLEVQCCVTRGRGGAEPRPPPGGPESARNCDQQCLTPVCCFGSLVLSVLVKTGRSVTCQHIWPLL